MIDLKDKLWKKTMRVRIYQRDFELLDETLSSLNRAKSDGYDILSCHKVEDTAFSIITLECSMKTLDHLMRDGYLDPRMFKDLGGNTSFDMALSFDYLNYHI